ncbi:MAG TPA: hypothetical protein VG168_11395 [Bryobacteraceae bacterium]|nr:hypothetical protein [Bryobacteraceae bacterium]
MLALLHRRGLPLYILAALLVCGILPLFSRGTGQVPPPILIEASESANPEFPGIPALQSFVSASWNGKWVIIGGRTNGYHQTGGRDTDFDRTQANQKIWVIDTSGPAPHKVYCAPVSTLPDSLALVRDQWMSSNLLYFQDGDTLYVAGGYGENSEHHWVTYPALSVVSLPALIDGVMNARPFSSAISFARSELVQSAGGDLIKLEDNFYVVMGHVFMGNYADFEGGNEHNSVKASQKYLGEIRKLSITRGPRGLRVSLVDRYSDPEFLRRDLNTTYTIMPDGKTLGAAAYGGVFTKDQLSFSRPIYFGPSSAPWVDDGYEQKMSAYACAKLLVFDNASQTMYTTFFGGISRWFWNYQKNEFEIEPLVGDKSKDTYYDGLQWIDQISTLVRQGRRTSEFVQPSNRLPVAMGAEGVFFPMASLREERPGTKILDARQFRGKRLLAGYLYGGIRAFPRQFPYRDDSPAYRPGAVPTKPSDAVLKVYVTVPETPAGG